MLGREREQLADALVKAAQHSTVELHFQKGVAGGSKEAIAATKETSTNPAMPEAFVLAIVAREGPPAYPGVRGHEPDLAQGRRNANAVAQAMNELRKIAPDAGSYVAESSFLERDRQRSSWGSNYARLLRIEREYDPEGLFQVHHGVGSEDWSDDGFTQVAER